MDGKKLPVCWAGCAGPNQNFASDGKCMETLGALHDTSGVEGVERFIIDKMDRTAYLETHGKRADHVSNASPEVEEAVLSILRDIADMDTANAVIFHSLLRGETMIEGAARCGFTKQAACTRIKNFCKTHPHFASLHVKIGGRKSNRNGVASFDTAQKTIESVNVGDLIPAGATKTERARMCKKYIIERPHGFKVVCATKAADIIRIPIGWVSKAANTDTTINGWKIRRIKDGA